MSEELTDGGRGDALLDGRESTAELIALLGHGSLRVRRSASAALSARDAAETLPGLLVAVGDEANAATRNAAAEVLQRYGAAVVPVLARALEPDRQRDRTIQLLTVLARIPSREALDAVLPLAGHPDPSVAAAAIGCLGALRDPAAIPALLAVLDRGERWQSFYAIDALGDLGHAAAVNRLVPLLDDPYYRKAVLRALGRIGDETAVPPIVALLRAEPQHPDRTALAALNEMVDRARTALGRETLLARLGVELQPARGGPLTAALATLSAEGGIEQRRHALRALGWLGDVAAVAPLVQALPEPALAAAAAAALTAIGPDAARRVLEAVRSLPPLPVDALRHIVGIVGRTPDASADEFLGAALDHEDDEVRQAAAGVLAGRAEGRRLDLFLRIAQDSSALVAAEGVRGLLAIAALAPSLRDEVTGRIDALTASGRPEVRRAAIQVLARLGGEGTREILDRALQDPAPEVRREAVGLLAEDSDPERLWRLAAALADGDARVREAALSAVSRLADRRVRGVLLAALQDQSLWVRSRAARALAAHPGPAVEAALLEAARGEVLPVRVAATEALGAMGPAAVPALRLLAVDTESEVRSAALRALGRLGPDAPVTLFAERLEDSAWMVRGAAAAALADAGSPAAFGILARALDREADTGVRRALLQAMFRADAEAALPILVTALAEKDVSESAAALLVEGSRMFADSLRAAWAREVDPAIREGMAVVLEEIGRREAHPVVITDGEQEPC